MTVYETIIFSGYRCPAIFFLGLQAFYTKFNIRLHALTFGRYLWLEGRYTGIVWLDAKKRQACVRAGTRVRDLNALLWEQGLAIMEAAATG